MCLSWAIGISFLSDVGLTVFHKDGSCRADLLLVFFGYRMDPQFSDPLAAISEDMLLQLPYINTQHWRPPRICPQPPTIVPVHLQCVAKFRMNAICKFSDDTTV
eukprot:g35015.t1